MVTVDGKKLDVYLQENIGKCAGGVFRDTVFQSSVDNHTRHSSYSVVRRAHNRSLHDPKAKNGKVKVYTHGEVHIMELMEALPESDRLIYKIIDDSKEPITIKTIMWRFNKAYPGRYSKNSRQIFVTITDNLYKKGLIKKLTCVKGNYVPHAAGKALYLQATPAHEVITSASATPVIEVAENAESQPVPPGGDAMQHDIHATINAWMDDNNIAEFSISIRKKE